METIGHKETRPDTILRLEFPQLYIYNINCDSSSELGIWPDRSTRTNNSEETARDEAPV